MSTSRPIALPSTSQAYNDSQDAPMSLGSYGNGGSFNPASYTKHYLGSPLSWRVGSFEGGVVPPSSPNQFFSQLEATDFKNSKMSSSIESDRGSLLNALGVFEREGELCKNYICCGINLQDLHALLEHFEATHVVNADPFNQLNPLLSYPTVNTQDVPTLSLPTAPTPTPLAHASTPTQRPSNSQSYFPDSQASFAPETTGPVDPDDMELEFDPSMGGSSQQSHQLSQRSSPMSSSSTPSSGAPSPPDTPISTPLSAYPSPRFPAAHTLFSSNPGSACPSPLPRTSVSSALEFDCNNVGGNLFDSPAVLRLPNHPHIRPHAQYGSRTPTEVFNAYAGYSDYSSSMPGTVPSPPATTVTEPDSAPPSEPTSPYNCVPPTLIWNSSAGPTPANTPSTSRVPSPSLTARANQAHFASLVSSPTSPHATTSFTGSVQNSSSTTQSGAGSSSSNGGAVRASTTLSRPASSLLLSKPFRCPKANCNKSYKQANGLKYHMTHGSCSFTPPKDLEQVQQLLASKRSQRSQQALSNLNSHDSSSEYDNGPTVDATQLGLGIISEGELREVEREAERRLRPFACSVGDCQRRYKNMNGLRYHYQHSGDHGAIGLALLASGQHECLNGGAKSLSASAASSRAVSRASTPFQPHSNHASQQSSPTQQQQQAQQNHTATSQQQAQAQANAAQIQQQLAHYNAHQQLSYNQQLQAQAQRAYAQQYAQHQRLVAEQQAQAAAMNGINQQQLQIQGMGQMGTGIVGPGIVGPGVGPGMTGPGTGYGMGMQRMGGDLAMSG